MEPQTEYPSSSLQRRKPPKTLAQTVVRRRYSLAKTIRKDRNYMLFLGLLFLVAGIVYPYPRVAMWFGFAIAAYSTIANDSIQTIGTFIASNHRRSWWVLWLFIGGVFLATMLYGWWAYSGDVSYGRLSSKGFSEAPTSFTFLQIAAPIFLLILTRMRMPVSTTFLILTCFATHPEGIADMLTKSISGYVVAFVLAIVVWAVVSRYIAPRYSGTEAPRYWIALQWLSTAFLWMSWLQQDAANIAVYLPRTLNAAQVAVFTGFIFIGLGLLFYLRGDRIQRVVDEKTDILDIRSATIIDFVYALILWYFKELNSVPMSTTWVFIGLLGGREVAISLFGLGDKRTAAGAVRLMFKDLGRAGVGLVVSILIALGTNPAVVADLLTWFD